jgi:hypothetical protein
VPYHQEISNLLAIRTCAGLSVPPAVE